MNYIEAVLARSLRLLREREQGAAETMPDAPVPVPARGAAEEMSGTAAVAASGGGAAQAASATAYAPEETGGMAAAAYEAADTDLRAARSGARPLPETDHGTEAAEAAELSDRIERDARRYDRRASLYG